MDEHFEDRREKILHTLCLHCWRESGWCITPGGREIRNIFRQHLERYVRAGVEPRQLALTPR